MKSSIRVVAMLLCSVAMSGKATKWDFPRPETIVKVKCTVMLVNLRLSNHDMWVAEAIANRNDPVLEDWKMEIGEFPATTKGLHQAEKVCNQWVDEANKQLGWARK